MGYTVHNVLATPASWYLASTAFYLELFWHFLNILMFSSRCESGVLALWRHIRRLFFVCANWRKSYLHYWITTVNVDFSSPSIQVLLCKSDRLLINRVIPKSRSSLSAFHQPGRTNYAILLQFNSHKVFLIFVNLFEAEKNNPSFSWSNYGCHFQWQPHEHSG